MRRYQRGPDDLVFTAPEVGSPKEMATRGGHASVVMILDRYGHRFPGSGERVNDALDVLAD
jgi:hypothetical protein